ncbi:MAG: lipase family protein [Proteobacteria bacterium]|nr:lipase family protein [Pseudomonadota bacterium]MBU1387079.1 lipase family protein [Pseudomonadota bacterium]MBU1541604.1 lipase family protein [Pseudomonadota bacterium]MBU2479512.1 lipase family protein [Pseudomonadota bacterium]
MNIKDQIQITARLSLLAYESSFPGWNILSLENKLLADGFEKFHWIENFETDTQCFLSSRDGYVYLTFRGSSTDADWETNFDFEQVPCMWGYLHGGFLADVKSVYWQIKTALAAYLAGGQKLIITGHSQGAAVAVIMGIAFLEVCDPLEAVIHFGGPRVADPFCADYIDDHFPNIFHRVVNNNDVVTRIPPRIMNYSHFGKLHYFLGDGTYTDNISEWGRFLDRMAYKIDFGGKYGIDIFNDHMPENYAALAEQLKLAA